MKIYQCDSCNKVIENPYEVKMKEFYIAVDFDECGSHPCNAKERVKIHLCEDCFNGLHRIAKDKVKKNG